MDNQPCLTQSEALAKEFAVLHRDLSKPLAALCISGGGIRSATFALGVLQGLAECNALGRFDYLSTVSGGGYIGAWLTAWIYREQGVDNVIPYLRRNAPPTPPQCPEPIEHLREYNSYLSPRLGAFSTDSWTLAATVLRNMILNWMVFVPLLMAALMLPRIIIAIARLGETFPLFYGTSPSITRESFHIGLPLLAGALFAMSVYNSMRYLPGVGGKEHTEQAFLKFVLFPMIGATFAFVTNDAWFTGGDMTRSTHLDSSMGVRFSLMVGSVILAGMVGWVAYIMTCNKGIKERLQLLLPVTLAMVLMGGITGSLAWLLAARAFPLFAWPVYTMATAPLLMIGILVAGCIFVGFSSNVLKDEDREWMSRAGAWGLLFVVCWAAACALVLILPKFLFMLPAWGKSVLGSAGAMGGWLTAITSRKMTPGEKKSSLASKLVAVFAAPVFMILFLAGLAMLTNWILMITGLGAHSDFLSFEVNQCPDCAWWDHRGLVEGTRWESSALLGAVFMVFSWVLAKFVNINHFSLHDMYRNRLVRAYLGASNHFRNANLFTGFAQTDDMAMSQLQTQKPFHVVNVTLNLVAGERLAWQQRKAASFTITPLHCGSAELGFRPSDEYGKGISLGTAITISGAAASPNMGYHSSTLLAFIMTLFNARLGAWLGNPGRAGVDTWRQAGPTTALGSLVTEAFGLANANCEYVNLSDGGHFENLGLYEMVRRRCRYIIVSDGGCDADFNYGDLGNALRKIRIDMKIPIEFEDRFLQPLRKKQKRCALARIFYTAVDASAEDGFLLYLKPMIRDDESPDIASYRADHPEFPHQSTADQFFDESQTEAYRALGLFTMDTVLSGWDRMGGIPGLFAHVAETHLIPGEGVAARQ